MISIIHENDQYESETTENVIVSRTGTYHPEQLTKFKEEDQASSLERCIKIAQHPANNTMSMWRPNLSQIARDEALKIDDQGPQNIISKFKKQKIGVN